MGKLIAFPKARVVRQPQVKRNLFQAFHELELSERAGVRLVAAFGAGALLLTMAVQLAAH